MSETTSFPADLLSLGVVPGERRRFLWLLSPQLIGSFSLAACDIVTYALALALILMGNGVFAIGFGSDQALNWAVLGGVAFAVAVPNGCLGLYEMVGRSPVERFRLRVVAAIILPLVVVASTALIQPNDYHALATLVAAAIIWLPLVLLTEQAVIRVLMAHSLWGTTAVLIGDREQLRPLAAFLLSHPETGIRPIGFCGPSSLEGASTAIKHLGSAGDARHLARQSEIAIVVLSGNSRAVSLEHLPFRRIIVLPDVSGTPSLWLRSRTFGLGPAFEFRNPLDVPANDRTKRAFDLLVAIPLFVAALPVIAALAIIIRVVSPGPALYVQQREGWRGRMFPVLKLRTMHLDAEQRLQDVLANDADARREWASYVKLSHDPRVLPFIGNFMRKTSLDELPQLWNVIRGEMSLVGPRPFPSYHLQHFDPAFRTLRASLRPGLTGLWQISVRSDADLPQQEFLDTFYIKNWSIWFDIYIAVMTVPAILSVRGAR